MEINMFYVARDKDCKLYLYFCLPTRVTSSGSWVCCSGDYMEIPNEMFPSLQWEDEPVQIGLVRINS